MKFRASITSVALALLIVGAPSAIASAKTSITMSLSQTPSQTRTIVTLYGSIKPARSGLLIRVQSNKSGTWNNTNLTTKSTKAGSWKVVADATPSETIIKYRVKVSLNGSSIYSPSKSIIIKPLPEIATADAAFTVEQLGPGERIHGADISRWQHPYNKAIDFLKMYSAGIRFVMIKAADTRDASDVIALKYLVMDHSAAQAAGIYTGFYYYAILPDVKTNDEVIRDATAQAQKATWRLAAIGGYSERDLPFALDIENSCVRVSSAGTCQKYATRAQVTLWSEVFLQTLKSKTGKTPILYSYSNFLEGSMNKSTALAQYPLWLAQYSINPFDITNKPGQKAGGCYVHSWTGANCDPQWTVWQYTSCGIASKYGVPSSRLDLNVFRGNPNAFLDLTKGSWTPQEVDLMPNNEASSMVINGITSTTSDKLVTIKVSVSRPDLTPVVTGTVKLVFDSLTTPTTLPIQTALRATSGEWSLVLKAVPAGTYLATVVYTDVTKTHAQSSQQLSFTVNAGPTPTPNPSKTPSPTKQPTPKPSVDSCAKQIRN